MKAHFRIIMLFIGSILWFGLLGFLAVRLGGRFPWWLGGNLPSPWPQLIAVVLDIGPVFIAGLLVLRRSYPLKAIHTMFRWLVYVAGSLALIVVTGVLVALLKLALGFP